MAISKIINDGIGDIDELTVDTNTLVVDSTNNRVGIGTSSPSYNLDIQGATDGNVIHRIKNSTAGTSARAGLYIDADDGNKGNLLATSSAYTGVGSWQDATVLNAGSIASGGLILNAQGGDIKFQRALAEKVRITSNGLTFNGDTAAANALDDYEEGTWTPSVAAGTVTAANARYTKIGDLVHITCVLSNFSDRTTATNVRISGLPFASSSSTNSVSAVLGRYANVGGDAIVNWMAASSSILYFYSTLKGGNYFTINHNNLNNSSASFYVSHTYKA